MDQQKASGLWRQNTRAQGSPRGRGLHTARSRPGQTFVLPSQMMGKANGLSPPTSPGSCHEQRAAGASLWQAGTWVLGPQPAAHSSLKGAEAPPLGAAFPAAVSQLNGGQGVLSWGLLTVQRPPRPRPVQASSRSSHLPGRMGSVSVRVSPRGAPKPSGCTALLLPSPMPTTLRSSQGGIMGGS